MTTISTTMIGQINLLSPTNRVDSKTGVAPATTPTTPNADVSQRSIAPTVVTENAARGVSSQVTGNIMALMLQQADQVSLSTDPVASAASILSVGDATDGSEDTVSILDVLDEMQAIIARYAPQGDETGIDGDLPKES